MRADSSNFPAIVVRVVLGLWLCVAAVAGAQSLPQCWRPGCQAQNVAPTANAGPDQTVSVGATVSLSGALSTDADGPQPLTYAWAFIERPAGSTAALANPQAVAPSFVVDRPGRYVIALRVGDGLATSGEDRVVVSTTNSPPVANAGPDQSVFVGDLVTLDGSGSTDVDGDALLYNWTIVAKPAGSNAQIPYPRPTTGPRVQFRVDLDGTYAIQLIVSDGKNLRSTPDIVLVSTGNTAPVAHARASCAALADTDCSVPIGSVVTIDGSGSTDVDGDALTYAWTLVGRPPGSSAVPATPTAIATTFATDAPGAFVVQLIVNDGNVGSAPRTLNITSTNVRPTAVAAVNPASIAALPRLVQLDGSASVDPEGQGLTYAWSLLAKPQGSVATLSSATAVMPTFTADLLGTYTAQLIVNDGFLPSNPVTVSASTVNQPPTANAGPDQTVVAGATAQLTSAGSSDPEGQPLGYFWSMLAKPPGSAADFNNANAANPTFVADRKGTFVAQLIVNDGVLDSAPDTVQVTATNRAPVAVADAYSVAQDGALVIGAVAGVLANDTDADGDSLTAVLVGAPPTGLVLNTNGSFSYSPPAGFSGSTPFQYKANDGTVDSNTVTVTITVTPGLPTVTIVATDPNASETGPDTGTFTITRTGPTTSSLGVSFGVGGTAQSGIDYVDIGFATTIPVGQSSVTVTITPAADAGIEGNETVVLTVTASGGYSVGAPSSATVTIADGVPNVVTIVATDPNASETGLDPGTFTISRAGPTTFALGVNFGVGGSAQSGVDYAGIGFATTIPAGQTSVTVTITPLADALIEGDETVVLTISSSPTTYQVGAPSSALVTIADGVPNVVTIVATDPNASETGSDPGTFTISRTGPTTFALGVNFGVGGTAQSGVDYAGIGFATTIPAGQTSVTVTITPLTDSLVEGDETVVLTLSASPTTYQVGAPSSALVTIADNIPPVVTIVATDPNASETGLDPGTFTFTRTGATTSDLPVFYSVGGTAINNGDYVNLGGTVVIPAGQSSATVTITPMADITIESDETVILTIAASPTTYVVGAPASATVTITDGVPNTITVVATDPNASETGLNPGTFTFTRTGPTTFDVPVFYSVGGTAINNGDYVNLGGTVVIPAGQSSAVVTITPMADITIESDETVILTIAASPTTYVVGAPASATVTITDGVPNTITVVATDPNASETGLDPGTFTFTRTGPTTFDVPVFYSVGGTAINNGDYVNLGGVVVIPAGQSSAVVTITPMADITIESDETVILTIAASPTTYVVGAPASATVTITDAVPNTITVAATDPNAAEAGLDPGVFTFTRTGPTTFDVSVFYSVGGTAINNGDYVNLGGVVQIPAGQSSATVTVTPLADGVSDPNETVILTITANPTTYVVGAQNSATVTIQ